MNKKRKIQSEVAKLNWNWNMLLWNIKIELMKHIYKTYIRILIAINHCVILSVLFSCFTAFVTLNLYETLPES